MAEKYDKNGYGGSDFKRNAPPKIEADGIEQDGEDAKALNAKAGEYVRELLGEKSKIDKTKFQNALRLLDQEIANVQSSGRVPSKDFRYVDIYREKPVKVSVKVLVPLKEHPKFNFVGKLLGPKGNTLKRLQEETMCKMAVLGRGSMKDRQKEEELRNQMDPKYAHLIDELHVEVTAMGPPAEAHARIAYALAEVRKYLIPDVNDVIRQEQMREIMEPGMMEGGVARGRGRGAPPPYRPPPMARVPTSRPPPPVVLGRAPVLPTPRVMPAKTKILSILDRARTAMEESYGYEEGYDPSAPIRHHGAVEADDPYGYAAPYDPTPPHHRHEHHYYGRHEEGPAEMGSAVAESYHYPREHEYGGSSTSTHHRSYKTGGAAAREPAVAGTRRPVAAVRDTRYRASPYTRPAK